MKRSIRTTFSIYEITTEREKPGRWITKVHIGRPGAEAWITVSRSRSSWSALRRHLSYVRLMHTMDDQRSFYKAHMAKG